MLFRSMYCNRCFTTSDAGTIFVKKEFNLEYIISFNSFESAGCLKPNGSSYAVGFKRVVGKCRNKNNVILYFNVIPTPGDFWIKPPAAFWSNVYLSLGNCRNH